MSLAFLCKKGWHTSGLQNVEKVWLAEEKVGTVFLGIIAFIHTRLPKMRTTIVHILRPLTLL